MNLIYNERNKIKFSSISEKYKVQLTHKANINEMHSHVISYVISHYRDTNKYRQKIVDALNLLTYCEYDQYPITHTWNPDSPFDTLPEMPSEDEMISILGSIYLTVEGIDWSELRSTHEFIPDNIYNDSSSVTPNLTDVARVSKVNSPSTTARSTISPDINKKSQKQSNNSGAVIKPTPKQDLYIQPPAIPQFDYKRPWMKCVDGPDSLVIYTTLPEIPTRQNEISVTTDVNKMTRKELMKLYPNHMIHTRASIMYEPLEGVELHPEFGLILPIEGYTKEQLIENLIKYPHIFKLLREVDNQYYSFYTHIEIDRELLGILDVWDNLPESKVLPRNKEFVKEYVVRRYLLERDIKHITHKYPIHGTFDSFLTLFMPADNYIKYGYNDVENLAKECVTSRVSYKQSRNPVIRRMMQHV